MTWIGVALAAAQLLAIAISWAGIRANRRELHQTRLLQGQMEEDHAVLVQNVLKSNDVLRRLEAGTEARR